MYGRNKHSRKKETTQKIWDWRTRCGRSIRGGGRLSEMTKAILKDKPYCMGERE